MYELLLGPLLWVAVLICVAGFCTQLFAYLRLLALSNGVTKPVPVPNRSNHSPHRPWRQRLRVRLALLKSSPPAAHPLLMVVSAVFHVLIFCTPIFLLAHNLLLFESWGFQPVSLRETSSDYLTLGVLGCCLFFFLRRLLDPHARSISSRSDYLLLGAIAAPFFTGFIATHQLFAYRLMVLLHMATAEILIAVMPFTKLMHMFFFFVNRLLGLTEYSYSRTRRLL